MRGRGAKGVAPTGPQSLSIFTQSLSNLALRPTCVQWWEPMATYERPLVGRVLSALRRFGELIHVVTGPRQVGKTGCSLEAGVSGSSSLNIF